MIPYGKQWIDEDDISEVLKVLQSDWLTTGPCVTAFEKSVAEYVGASHAVAVSSGTAALHALMNALDIKENDEVIVPPITFAATANAVVYCGGTPVFADVESDTLLLDPAKVEQVVTDRTKAIIGVDFAGQPCDYEPLKKLATECDAVLLSDACHAIGGRYKGRDVGTLAHATVFSFHPVKHITTGEGGMIVTDDENVAHRMRVFRNHGITTDFKQREEKGHWYYEIEKLGYNYRLTDIQCALGISQLKKIDAFLDRRRKIASRYDAAFSNNPVISPLTVRKDVLHAYHLYVVKIEFDLLSIDRETLFKMMRDEGIGVNVHYIPVHYHPFYRQNFNTGKGLCPVAEKAYEQIISLPIFPQMTNDDVQTVIESLDRIVHHHRKHR